MLGRFASQIVAGIIAAMSWDFVKEYGISNPEDIRPGVTTSADTQRRRLQDEIEKVQELGESASSGDPEKIFELAVLGLDEYFDSENVETASIGLLSVLVESESCGTRWEQYAKRSRTFLSSYLATPYAKPDDVTRAC